MLNARQVRATKRRLWNSTKPLIGILIFEAVLISVFWLELYLYFK